MVRMTRLATLAVASVLAFSACGSSQATQTPASVTPTAFGTAAPSSAAPGASATATAQASASASAPASSPSTPGSSPSMTAACVAPAITTINSGTLTVGTDNPAFPPWFGGEPPAGSPWQVSDPTSQMGLESATAYALAQQLGFASDKVTWVAVPFNNAIQPGPKTFDLLFNQVSYSPARAKAVDLSDGYFDNSQAVVTDGKLITSASTIADLKKVQFGVQVGTTSLAYIDANIKPDKAARVYNSNDAAVAALKAKQIDGIVVDLGTAFYMVSAQLDNGRIVGTLPDLQAPEHFSVLLQKGSALTTCVNQGLMVLKDNGTLTTIRKIWIESQGDAPAITP